MEKDNFDTNKMFKKLIEETDNLSEEQKNI